MAFVVTQTMLDEAQSAYHSLMLGQNVAEFRDQNGERVVYGKADAARLLNYINWLKSELKVVTVSVAPMQVWM
jgi:hypothetical protein